MCDSCTCTSCNVSRYEQKLEEEISKYYPFGRGGSGAPMKDAQGNTISKFIEYVLTLHIFGRYIGVCDSHSCSKFVTFVSSELMHLVYVFFVIAYC